MSISDSIKLFSSLWSPSVLLAGPSKLPSTGLQDSCTKGFHFLIRLAWESRYLLPAMYLVFSFIFDIQMRLEIIIHRERRIGIVEEEVLEAEEEEVDTETEGEYESHSEEEEDSFAGDEVASFES